MVNNSDDTISNLGGFNLVHRATNDFCCSHWCHCGEKRACLFMELCAREFSIPCVNGVTDAMIHIKNGDEVTVDGYLGIVSLGKADFGLG